MATQQAKNRAKTKYNAKAYDQLKIYVKKNGREFINKIAKESGKSTAQYLRDLIIADATKKGSETEQEAREALLPDPPTGGGGALKAH